MHGQLRMRTTVPFGKKTMLSTFHIDKVINNNKELFTRLGFVITSFLNLSKLNGQ